MFFSKVRNFFGKKSLVSKPDTVSQDVQNIINSDNNYAVWQLISRIRDISQTREYKYAEYDIMSAEVIINAALNMYADDSTQVNINSGKILSITSKNDVLVKDLYSFLERINFENFLWDIAFSLAKYGNKYIKIHMTEDFKDIDHVESIDDPACVMDLYLNGQPVYFAENPNDRTMYKEAGMFNIYTHNAFVHYYIRSTSQSDVVEIVDNSKIDDNGEPMRVAYKIMEGESLLEGVRVIYRILQSLEDSLLAARLAKADFIRIFNIDVGNSSNTDARLIVNKVKKLFDSTVSMDLRNGNYSAVKQPRAWADPIFNATSNGKGAITSDTIGGDFEVKNIIDIDYFTNKLFAGLRIPKPFLGFEETLGGSLDQGGVLSQLDIRYSRFVRKIMDAICAGTKELCNAWLTAKGRKNEIGKFSIVYTSPSSLEDYHNMREIKERANIVSDLVGTITSNAPDVNSAKILKELLVQFIPYQDFLDKVTPLIDESIKQSESQEEEGMEGEEGFGEGGEDFSFDREEDFSFKEGEKPSGAEKRKDTSEPEAPKEEEEEEKASEAPSSPPPLLPS